MNGTDAFVELPLERVAVVLVDFQDDFCTPEILEPGRPVTHARNARTARRADGRCGSNSWDAALPPVPGAAVVIRDRFGCWQCRECTACLDAHDADGQLVCGVEPGCCVRCAVLGAAGRSHHAFLRFTRPDRTPLTANEIHTRRRPQMRTELSQRPLPLRPHCGWKGQ